MERLILTNIFLVASCIQTQVFACEKLTTRYIDHKKPIIQKEVLCFEDEKPSSKNCTPILNKKCYFSKIKTDVSFKQFISPMGSPGFGLCYHLGGLPQIYEVEIKGQWKIFDRCFSADKKEFVDIDNLIRLYP